MADTESFKEIGAKHPHEGDIVHPLHKLRRILPRHDRAQILYRHICQRHPGRIGEGKLREILAKHRSIVLRRAVAFVQSLDEGQQTFFEHGKRIRQLCADRDHFQQPKPAFQLVAHGSSKIPCRELGIGQRVFHVFIGEYFRDTLYVIRVIQERESVFFLQQRQNLQNAVSGRRELIRLELALAHSIDHRLQGLADLLQLCDHSIGYVQRSAADVAGGKRNTLIRDLVPPVVQRQHIVLGDIHNDLSLHPIFYVLLY